MYPVSFLLQLYHPPHLQQIMLHLQSTERRNGESECTSLDGGCTLQPDKQPGDRYWSRLTGDGELVWGRKSQS